MSPVVQALASFVHLAGVALAVAFGVLRLRALRHRDVAATRFADNGNGLAAILLFGGGLWRQRQVLAYIRATFRPRTTPATP